MSNAVLEIRGLTKSYHKMTVVDNFNLSVEKGHIYGLIGPNGAGKTTIMKILAGLVCFNKGEILFWGEKNNHNSQRKRMSFMIENPMLDGNMTAKENLMYLRYIRGVADEKRIDEVLNFVEIKDDRKKTSKFSLGMKQRLAIAMALLSSPEIMILDEPINGVDPEGIVDIRRMLERLSSEYNVTILISSHILSEMSELCTDFAIINHGKLVENLSSEELNVKCRNHIAVKTNNIEKTVFVLENILNIKNYSVLHNDEIHIFERLNEIEVISKTITDSGLILTKLNNDSGLILTKLNNDSGSLEEYYLSKVGDI